MFDEDHESFRKTFRAFLESEVVPHFDEWYAAGIVPREVYHQLAELGIFGIEVPEEYGGAGLETFKYEAVLLEETARAASTRVAPSPSARARAPSPRRARSPTSRPRTAAPWSSACS